MSLIKKASFILEAWRMAGTQGKQAGQIFGSDAVISAGGLLAGIFRGGGQPPRRGTQELMNAYKLMPWLQAVNRKISTGVASVPWELYVQRPGGNGRAVRNLKLQRADMVTRAKLKEALKDAGELREIEKHPLLDMLENANPVMTGRTARQVTQTYLDLKGEAFWVLERNQARMPIEYWPVPPHWIKETPSPGRPSYRVSFKGWQGNIPETEIVWIKDPDPENPYGRGTGIAESLADELETDEYAAKYAKAWFYNRATPDLLIGVEGANEADLKRAQAKWEERHQGFWKAFKSHWHSGKMQVHQLGQNLRQQQLIEIRNFERDTVVQVYGVSPEILGIIENSNRSTIEAAEYMFPRWVLVPRLEFLRSEMQERLVPQFDERLILDYVSPVPDDREFFLKVAEKATWTRTRNEWRKMQGLPPDEEAGNYYYVPVGILPEKQGEEPETGLPQFEGAVPAAEQHKQASPLAVAVEAKSPNVNSVLEQLRPEHLALQVLPRYERLIETWGNRVLQELDIDISFNLLNPKVIEHLQNLSAVKIKGMNDVTRGKLRVQLVEGVREGEGIPAIAKRVSTVFQEAKGPRARTIARTEVLSGSNHATTMAHEISGVVSVREWLATRDDRVRDEHLLMDKQQRAINQPFTCQVTGHTAMYPGDFGMAELDINCRCTTFAVIKDPKGYTDEQRTELWKRFDRALIPWERAIEAAVKRGFQKQESEIIQALNNLREE